VDAYTVLTCEGGDVFSILYHSPFFQIYHVLMVITIAAEISHNFSLNDDLVFLVHGTEPPCSSHYPDISD